MLTEGAGTIKATLVPHLDAHQNPQEGDTPGRLAERHAASCEPDAPGASSGRQPGG
jgi:hypothetical protein